MDISSLDLPGIPKLRSGKVREVFDLGADGLLFVATDRLSAFDCILPDPIPGKGEVLTQLSAFWFAHLRARGSIADHLITTDFARFPARLQPFHDQLAGRSMIVRRARPLPVECVVRGYLAGSGWKEYQATGSVCGHKLPPGLQLADALPEPLFTPASKNDHGHDENIDWPTFVERLDDETVAVALRAASLQIYSLGAKHAAERGIIIADTKFEFGVDERTDEILLIDEVLTPDSSRFWPAHGYRPGISPPSYDKQFVRDYLETLKWDKTPPAPGLPPEIIAQTAGKYQQALREIGGERTLTS